MTGRKNALAVREAIEAEHHEIQIKSPLTSRSGKWELTLDGATTATYDDFWMMVDFLAARFDDIVPDADPTA
ncbi:MAG: hypothetical protein ACRDOI_18595 [Trebonia sp.]